MYVAKETLYVRLVLFIVHQILNTARHQSEARILP